MSYISGRDLERWFTYHPSSPGQEKKYEQIREAALAFSIIIVATTPSSPDQTTAIRKIREAVMTANAAIACEEKT